MQYIVTSIEIYRQQLAGMQHLAAASLSGFERAQQSALQMTRQMMDQQLDVAGRMAQQASAAVFDPEPVRPAVEQMMRAQRQIVDAVTDTQRRYADAITAAPANGEQSQQAVAGYADAVQQTVQQWQRWMDQVFSVVRDEAEQMSRSAQESAHSAGSAMQAAGQAMQNSASTQPHGQQPGQGQRKPEGKDKAGQRIIETA